MGPPRRRSAARVASRSSIFLRLPKTSPSSAPFSTPSLGVFFVLGGGSGCLHSEVGNFAAVAWLPAWELRSGGGTEVLEVVRVASTPGVSSLVRRPRGGACGGPRSCARGRVPGAGGGAEEEAEAVDPVFSVATLWQ